MFGILNLIYKQVGRWQQLEKDKKKRATVGSSRPFQSCFCVSCSTRNIITNLTRKHKQKNVKKASFQGDFRAFAVLVIDSNKSAKTLRGGHNGSVSDGEERTGKKEEKEGDAVHPL